MSEEIKNEETNVAKTEQGSELSADQLDDASGSGYIKYELKNVQVTNYDVNASGNGEAQVDTSDDRLTISNIGSSGQDG